MDCFFYPQGEYLKSYSFIVSLWIDMDMSPEKCCFSLLGCHYAVNMSKYDMCSNSLNSVQMQVTPLLMGAMHKINPMNEWPCGF